MLSINFTSSSSSSSSTSSFTSANFREAGANFARSNIEFDNGWNIADLHHHHHHHLTNSSYFYHYYYCVLFFTEPNWTEPPNVYTNVTRCKQTNDLSKWKWTFAETKRNAELCAKLAPANGLKRPPCLSAIGQVLQVPTRSSIIR